MSQPPPQPGAFIGLDLGTSGLKAVALDRYGRPLARASARYPTEHPEPGSSEQHPHHWLTAAATALRELAAQLDGRATVRALGLSAMMPTLVAANTRLEPVAPAITWQDARAEDDGQRLRAAVGPGELYQLTGQWLDGRYLLPMYLALRARATTPSNVSYLLSAKDWLLAQLTGQVVTDPSTATGFGAYRLTDGTWHQPVLDAASEMIREPLPALPHVVPSHATYPLTAEQAQSLGMQPGLPVCVGGADSVMGVLGLGATTIGDVAYIAGTSTAIVGVAETWRPDPQHRYIGTPLAGIDGFGLELDLLATGSAVRWLTDLLNVPDETALVELAHKIPIEDAPPFLPYLAPGEQGALWDPQLRGAIVDLSLTTTPGHLARGLLTGILLESRRCLRALAQADVHGHVLVAGGSSRDSRFRTDLADACGRTVRAPSENSTDYSAAGAARLAAAAVGEPINTPARMGEPAHPDPRQDALWATLSERHDLIRTALSAVPTTKEPA